jgi:hypothetical protein
MVLAFDQNFKLFIPSSDFIPERFNYFISLFFYAFLKLSKFVLNYLEVVLEFLEDTFCLLTNNSIDWGLDACHSLWEKGLDMWIFSLIDEFTLDLKNRFKHPLNFLLRLHLIGRLNIARSQSFGARSMNHFDRIAQRPSATSGGMCLCSTSPW